METGTHVILESFHEPVELHVAYSAAERIFVRVEVVQIVELQQPQSYSFDNTYLQHCVFAGHRAFCKSRFC